MFNVNLICYYNTKSLAYTSLVRPILDMGRRAGIHVRPIPEYGAACWDPYRECQISALDQVQNKAAKFAHHSEVQTGNLWHSVGRQNECVRSTKRIPERGPGRR